MNTIPSEAKAAMDERQKKIAEADAARKAANAATDAKAGKLQELIDAAAKVQSALAEALRWTRHGDAKYEQAASATVTNAIAELARLNSEYVRAQEHEGVMNGAAATLALSGDGVDLPDPEVPDLDVVNQQLSYHHLKPITAGGILKLSGDADSANDPENQLRDFHHLPPKGSTSADPALDAENADRKRRGLPPLAKLTV